MMSAGSLLIFVGMAPAAHNIVMRALAEAESA